MGKSTGLEAVCQAVIADFQESSESWSMDDFIAHTQAKYREELGRVDPEEITRIALRSLFHELLNGS